MANLRTQHRNSFTQSQSHHFNYAMVGNPNCGKSTLFNHLTGQRQKIANYSGVTVEKKIGTCFSQHGLPIKLIDLPGSQSLSAQSPDEEIMQKVLIGRQLGEPQPDRVICVLDSSNLEKHLYLATQVSELGLPTILVLNMSDIAQKNDIFIDTSKIERELGVHVITTQANKKKGLLELKLLMSRQKLSQPKAQLPLPEKISEAVLSIQSTLLNNSNSQNLAFARGKALILLTEGADEILDGPEVHALVNHWQKKLDAEPTNWRDEIINLRKEKANNLFKTAVFHRSHTKESVSQLIDKFVLHKFFGWVLFFMIMAGLFWSIFSLSKYPMDAIEWGFEEIGNYATQILPDGPIQGLVVDGIISGVGSIIVFLPQICLLFFFIGILESSGYLPRAALLMDKVMRKVGLQGKSFIPLLSSYACAVPGIMATRTIADKKERFTTIMIAPWMSCSARLPVYLLMIATLVPNHQASPSLKAAILFGAYFLGTFVAFAVAWLFRKTLLKGKNSTAQLDLPLYRLPCWKHITSEVIFRGWTFLKRAGTVILAFSIIMWFLMSYPQADSTNEAAQLTNSYIGKVGQTIEPVIKPLGYDWKIGIGILVSFAARELFVSTMAIIYNVESGLENESSLAQVLQNQTWSDGLKIFTPLTCLSLMVFFIFAMQCISTLAIVKKETNSWRWPIFQLVYMTAFAYLAALIIFQGGKFLGFS